MGFFMFAEKMGCLGGTYFLHYFATLCEHGPIRANLSKQYNSTLMQSTALNMKNVWCI